MPTFSSDGDYGSRVKNGAARVHFPFLNLNDTTNYFIETLVDKDDVEAKTAPAINAAATAADEVTGLSGEALYMIDESPLDPGAAARGIERVSRFWAPKWTTIVDFGSYPMQLPDLRGLSYDPGSGAVSVTYDESTRSQTIDSGGTAVVSAALAALTAGTWTHTDANGNVAGPISWNETDANILTELQTESPNFTAVSTGSDNRIQLTREYTSASVVSSPEFDISNFDLTGLTPEMGLASSVRNVSGPTPPGIKDITETYYLYAKLYEIEATAHGLTTGDKVYLRDGSGTIGLYEITRVDADNFTVVTDDELSGRTVTEFADAGFYYVRSKNVPCRYEHQFFMPTVTPGIASAQDIPKVAAQNYDYAILQAMVDGTEEITVAVSEIDHPYPGVYTRVLTKIYMEDIYD